MNLIENITKIIECIAAIVALIAAVGAFLYIGRFRDKMDSATFSFWSQIRISILYLREQLSANHAIIDNMYGKEDFDRQPEDFLSTEVLDSFYEAAKRLLNKLETADNQVPAYIGWTTDITIFSQFLIEVLIYDVRDPNDKYKLVTIEDNGHGTSYSSKFREKEVSSILDVMDRLIRGIEKNQKKIEKRITSKGLLQMITKKALPIYYKTKDFLSKKLHSKKEKP